MGANTTEHNWSTTIISRWVDIKNRNGGWRLPNPSPYLGAEVRELKIVAAQLNELNLTFKFVMEGGGALLRHPQSICFEWILLRCLLLISSQYIYGTRKVSFQWPIFDEKSTSCEMISNKKAVLSMSPVQWKIFGHESKSKCDRTCATEFFTCSEYLKTEACSKLVQTKIERRFVQ